jgi:hypothetical protein
MKRDRKGNEGGGREGKVGGGREGKVGGEGRWRNGWNGEKSVEVERKIRIKRK